MKTVAIFMGSKSDYEFVRGAISTLEHFDIKASVEIISAHRCMDKLHKRIEQLDQDDAVAAIIGVAGGAAHLPGVIAALTVKPVIGVPVPTSFCGGLDSLLSICQMPGGIPVATVAAGKSGPKNAALIAVEIIGLMDRTVRQKLIDYRQDMREKVEQDNASIQ